MVEQPVGQVVGGGVLAQAGDRGREGRSGGWVAVGGAEAGAGQAAFGAPSRQVIWLPGWMSLSVIGPA